MGHDKVNTINATTSMKNDYKFLKIYALRVKKTFKWGGFRKS